MGGASVSEKHAGCVINKDGASASDIYSLCKKENTLGFIFSGMQKSELFDAVKQDGALPRKTFSMGHASDKRFYIEAREI